MSVKGRRKGVILLTGQRGSVLVITLIVISILSLLLITAALIVAGGQRRAVSAIEELQAFYLAEAGVEEAIQKLRDDWDISSYSSPLQPFPPSPTPLGEYRYTISSGGSSQDTRVIRAWGIVRGEERAHVRVELYRPSVSFPRVLEDGIFARERISLSGSPWIRGPVNTNSTQPGAIFLDWTTGIQGSVSVGPRGDPNQVITGPGTVQGSKLSLAEEYLTPLPVFPEFPSHLPSRGDFTAGWWPAPPYYITADGSYGTIDVQSTLIIDVGNEVRRIRVRNLRVTGSGKIILQGTGKLELYVDNTFTLANGGGINVDSRNNPLDPSQLLFFYQGRGELSFPGNVRFAGSIYAMTANVRIDNSGMVRGNIVTGGNTVTISGDSRAFVRALYAPNAQVTLSGSGSLRGTIVARILEITGGGSVTDPRVVFDTAFVDHFPFSFDSLMAEDIKIKKWEEGGGTRLR